MPFSLYVDLGRDHHDSYSVLSLLLLPSGAQVLEDCCSQHACWASIIPPRTYCKAPYACCPGPYFFFFFLFTTTPLACHSIHVSRRSFRRCTGTPRQPFNVFGLSQVFHTPYIGTRLGTRTAAQLDHLSQSQPVVHYTEADFQQPHHGHKADRPFLF